jgi:hypothetical protein
MTAHVIPFKPRLSTRPVPVPSPLPLPPAAHASNLVVNSTVSTIDLSGKRKAIFLVGRGRIGKTTLARWIADTMDARGGTSIIAAADPVNRSLRAFQDNVAEPPSTDPTDTKDWLLALMQFAMEGEHNVIIDLGGGSTALSALLADMPDLTTVLGAHDLHPVAVHLLGPDPHDLVPLALAESELFTPDATALVLNLHHGRVGRFASVLEHPTYLAAIARGAIPIWMPLLTPDVARQCDANAWHYHDVSSVAGPFAISAVNSWMTRMSIAFEPIASWLP